MAKGTKRAKIKKGDQVVVIAGRDRDKRGRVLEVMPSKGKVKVEGIGKRTKHERPNRARGTQGGIIEKEGLIDISNVMLIDPQSGRPTRVRYETQGDAKMRVAVRSGQTINTK
jgi:large subunit ribosomal protein L24